MPINSVHTALQLLTGAGELTRAKALEAAGTLLELPGVGETSARAGQLAEELIEAASANQAMLQDVVRTEVDRRLLQLGLARGSDLEAAQRKIATLEAEVAALRGRTGVAGSTGERGPRPSRAGIGTQTTATKRPARTSVAQRTAARPSAQESAAQEGVTSATGKKAAAKKTTRQATGTKATGKNAAAKKTTRQTTGKKTAAKKTARSTAQRATAAKTTAQRPGTRTAGARKTSSGTP